MNNKRVVAFEILQGLVFNVSAAPEDHGRIFNDNSPLSIVLGGLILLFLLICWIVSKFPTKETLKTHTPSNTVFRG